jgi:DNA-binding PadR family transcriptional regulator
MAGQHGEHGFGPGFMGGFGRGGGWFRAGRRIFAADLQTLILALLAEKPHHGYELIKVLEERSGGFYHPSPGTIYPALTYLEEIGYATVQEDGNRKLYSITDAGRRHLEEHRSAVDTMLSELGRMGEKMDRVRRAFTGDHDDEDDGFEARGTSRTVESARRVLKAALREKRHCSPEDAERIAKILNEAAAQILRR